MSNEKAIIKAAKNGDAQTVRDLLDADSALIDARDTDGSTPLHCASWKGHTEVVSLLIARGADVNSQNANTHWGGTPLHAAAHANNTEIVRLLIARGADVHARSINERAPIDETVFHNAKASARVLSEKMAGG